MTTHRGVLWDMDGVLIDTAPFHFRSWSEVLPEYNIPFTLEKFKSTFGMNNTGVLTSLMGRTPPPDLVAEIADRKERRFRELIHGQARLLPGVLDWLQRLKAEGARQAVASSAPQANIDALVDELDIRRFFDALVSGVALPAKPDPALFLEAARRIGVPREQCVVVEDAIAGVEAARRGGMKCIAVTTTNAARALSTADVVVDRLDTLPPDAFDRLFLIS